MAREDNLTSIAEKYYSNASMLVAKKIAEFNDIPNIDIIYAGTELRLPYHFAHIVQERETFNGIADLYGISQ